MHWSKNHISSNITTLTHFRASEVAHQLRSKYWNNPNSQQTFYKPESWAYQNSSKYRCILLFSFSKQHWGISHEQLRSNKIIWTTSGLWCLTHLFWRSHLAVVDDLFKDTAGKWATHSFWPKIIRTSGSLHHQLHLPSYLFPFFLQSLKIPPKIGSIFQSLDM